MKLAKRICLFLAALILVCVAFVVSGSTIVRAAGQGSKTFTPTHQQVNDDIAADQSTSPPGMSISSFSQLSQVTYYSNASSNLLGGTDSSGNVVIVGVVPQMGQAMAYMISQPPASGQVWMADLIHNSPLLGEKAYAQGVGFNSLTPVLPIWKTFRDLSYIAFIFAFVIVGFMIMFRHKLDGQTVATISNALPRMVVTLLLITFSYAIAGFLIDIMYIVIYFICGVFANLITIPGGAGGLANLALSNNIITNGLHLIWDGNSSVAGGAAAQLGNIVQGFFNNKDALSNDVGVALSGTASVIGFLIFAVAIFFAVIKTFFELLKSYITFIIMVIFSPFQLLLGMFKEGGDFGQWLRNMVATLAPFPVVILMLFLAMALGGQGAANVGFTEQVGDNARGFQPPQLNIGAQSGAVGAVQGLMVIGIVMLIPEAVEISKKFLKATSPFDEYLPKITKNLEMGWKGGQVVPGFGPTIPGVGKVIPGLAKIAGSGAAGAGIGALGGGGAGLIYGASKGIDEERAKGSGSVRQAARGIVYGGLMGAAGAAGGAGVGAAVGLGAPKIIPSGLKAYNTVAKKEAQVSKVIEQAGDIYRTTKGKAQDNQARVASTPESAQPV